jgi:hypothetical protein
MSDMGTGPNTKGDQDDRQTLVITTNSNFTRRFSENSCKPGQLAPRAGRFEVTPVVAVPELSLDLA